MSIGIHYIFECFSCYSWCLIAVRSYRFQPHTRNRFNSLLTTSAPLYSNDLRDFMTFICTENICIIKRQPSPTQMCCIFLQLKCRSRYALPFGSGGSHKLINFEWIWCASKGALNFIRCPFVYIVNFSDLYATWRRSKIVNTNEDKSKNEWTLFFSQMNSIYASTKIVHKQKNFRPVFALAHRKRDEVVPRMKHLRKYFTDADAITHTLQP